MTEARRRNLKVLSALKEKRHEAIVIRKLDDMHFLVVTVDGESVPFADLTGKHKTYRHAWQIRSWLHEEFGIEGADIPIVAMS